MTNDELEKIQEEVKKEYCPAGICTKCGRIWRGWELIHPAYKNCHFCKEQPLQVVFPDD